jgi:hypothetical protein
MRREYNNGNLALKASESAKCVRYLAFECIGIDNREIRSSSLD